MFVKRMLLLVGVTFMASGTGNANKLSEQFITKESFDSCVYEIDKNFTNVDRIFSFIDNGALLSDTSVNLPVRYIVLKYKNEVNLLKSVKSYKYDCRFDNGQMVALQRLQPDGAEFKSIEFEKFLKIPCAIKVLSMHPNVQGYQLTYQVSTNNEHPVVNMLFIHSYVGFLTGQNDKTTLYQCEYGDQGVVINEKLDS